MFGLTPLTTFMMFLFWPGVIVGAILWGRLAFNDEGGLDE